MRLFICNCILLLANVATADNILAGCRAEKECYFGELYKSIDITLMPPAQTTHGVTMALARFVPSSDCAEYFVTITNLKARMAIKDIAVGPARTRCNAKRMYIPFEIGCCYTGIILIVYVSCLIFMIR